MSGSRNPNLGVIATAPQDTDGEPWRKNLGRTRALLSLPRPESWWTGLEPADCPGFSDGCLRSLPMPDLASCSRAQVLDYFNNTWTLNEVLFSALIGEEPFYRPPYHSLRHPLIFYYVHPSVLYISKLRLAGLYKSPVNPYFESLFETGVDEMSWDDMSKNVIEWPSVDDALHYRRQVYNIVKSLIENHADLADGHAPILQGHPLWSLFMGFEHERIHLETSSVLIRELPVHLVSRPQAWPELAPMVAGGEKSLAAERNPEIGRDFVGNKFVAVAAQTVSIGKPFDWPTYGWDNEYGQRSPRVDSFEASQFLISNGEFWHFVAAGGYHERKNWSETGWQWRSFRNVKWPTFWVPDGPAGAHQYRLRTCFENISMQWNWPAVVNYHEAEAYCLWRGQQNGQCYRLITEAEHQALRHCCQFDHDTLDNRSDISTAASFNHNLRYGSESAVDAGGAPFGDVFGNVWQWCEDHFNPLEGFRIHRFYDDFSTPCFDGQHQMILGGSFISTGDEASSWARFHFRPHFFQHAGFRMVRAAGDGAVVHLDRHDQESVSDKAEAALSQMMTLHFGSTDLQMPFAHGPQQAVAYTQRCAELVSSWCKKEGVAPHHVLDLGCAVGGASFSLAETFDRVTAVDLSKDYIEAANRLKNNFQLGYTCKIEGEIVSQEKAKVDKTLADRVQFKQADACALPADYMDFDAVLMADLLCHLSNPASCLRRMSGDRGIVRPGGLLVIVSPFGWQQNQTIKDLWLGGFVDSQGQAHWSSDGLSNLLGSQFELLDRQDMPLLVREHRRKYQYIVAEATVWRRRA